MAFWDDYNKQAQLMASRGGVQDWQLFRQQLPQQSPPQQQQAPQKKKKGFWTDQISTGGGIGGALAGGAAGAAIGSVVPVVGTAIGGLAGALLGGALGSGGGEMAENAITGDDLMKNVGQEAVIGGATSLPLGASIKLARAGIKATTGLGKASAGELVQQAGMQTIPKRTVAKLVDNGKISPTTLDDALKVGTAQQGSAPLRTSFTGKLQDRANTELAKQYGPLSKPAIRATNPAQTVGELADIGLMKPTDVERVANAITGSGGILNQQVAKAVGNARNVDTSGLRDVFMSALDNYGVVDKDRKSLEAMFKSQMGRLNGGARGSLTGANATDTLSVMKSLESKIADLRGKGGNYRMTTPERSDMANALSLVKDELQDRLYSAAGANKNLQSLLTPELRKNLLDLMPGNTQWAKHVNDTIMKATDVGSIRSAQAPFVRANQMINEAADNAFSVGSRMVNNTQGIKDAIISKAGELVANPARRGFASAVKRAGGNSLDGALQAGSANAVGQGIAGLVTRQGAGRLVTQGEDPSVNQLPSTIQEGQVQDAAGLPIDTQGQVSSPFGYSSTEIGQALMKAYTAGDAVAAKQLESMYELAAQMESQTGGSQLSSSAATQVASNANATNTLDQLESLFGTAGGGSGKIGGTLQNALAGMGMSGDVQTYNDLSSSSVSQLARALNGGGQVSDADAAVVIQALPKITDSPEVAARKFAAIRARLQNAMQNTLAYSGGVNPGGQEATLL